MKPSKRAIQSKRLTEIGWREIVGLPELRIGQIKAKIDTGARTSALHALDQKPFERDGVAWIAFCVPARAHREPIRCLAPIADQRAIKNTSGVPEPRYIIRTALTIGGRRWRIEVSLSDRSEMEFDLILGRSAIRGHNFLVNPGRSFLVGSSTDPSAITPEAPDQGLLRTLDRGGIPACDALENGEEE